jgi:hypothetical protein
MFLTELVLAVLIFLTEHFLPVLIFLNELVPSSPDHKKGTAE